MTTTQITIIKLLAACGFSAKCIASHTWKSNGENYAPGTISHHLWREGVKIRDYREGATNMARIRIAQALEDQPRRPRRRRGLRLAS